MKTETLLVNVAEMAPHPLLGRAGLLPDLIAREKKMGAKDGDKRGAHKEKAAALDADFAPVRESVRETGITYPLEICAAEKGSKWWIVDGRHRWMVAQELGMESVPCVVIAAEDAAKHIMAAAARRRMSLGALAYLAVILNPQVGGAKRGRPDKSAANAELSAADLAAKTGVSTRLVEDAVWLFKAFSKRADLRDKFEPGIWIGNGLDRVKSGVAAALEGKDTGKADEPEIIDRSASAVNYRRMIYGYSELAEAWSNWDAVAADPMRLDDALSMARDSVLKAPKEVRAAMREALEEEEA